MTWYHESVFYHIYPLGLSGAEKKNPYKEPVHRLNEMKPWIDHISSLGFNALYIGPLFESVGHGYETTDYRKLDTRLGTNEDLKEFVRYCHEKGVRVVLDAVFNHTGRDFFAFRDIKNNREHSQYLNWYCNVNFYGNNEYNDGFSYDNWGGYNLLAKLNLKNPDVVNYHLDTVRFWVNEFDIDGLRLDTADVLDFDFMRSLRALADTLKEDFWLMGEVIHGEYSRWVNDSMLHSVTNYALHKALYSGHNDHNYFEIAHTVRRMNDMGMRNELYSFVDNHDTERIINKLSSPAYYLPVHVLLYTLPGIPSVYYGSEFAVEGKKQKYSDDSIRPCLDLKKLQSEQKPYPEIINALTHVRTSEKDLAYGEYRELELTTEKYAFARGDIIVTVSSTDSVKEFNIKTDLPCAFTGALSGAKVLPTDGILKITLNGVSGEIWLPETVSEKEYKPVTSKIEVKTEKKIEKTPQRASGKSYEEMTVEELQAEILAKMAANGPVTERMKQDVMENVYRDSLLNWVRSFR